MNTTDGKQFLILICSNSNQDLAHLPSFQDLSLYQSLLLQHTVHFKETLGVFNSTCKSEELLKIVLLKLYKSVKPI